ncbi:MAG: PLP-dependent transferase [Oligoflexales bacterium]|nr:PLP-dependent transferase [Oligoflexales bacterium]
MKKNPTSFIHRKKVVLPAGNFPLVSPIYQSAKFSETHLRAMEENFANPDELHFVYSRIANPTVRELELNLAHLQGAEDGLAFSSGMAAISCTLLGLLSPGDELLMFAHSYVTARQLAKGLLSRMHIKTHLLALDDWAAIEKVLASPNCRVCLFESPTNPMLRVPDLNRLLELCKKHKVISILDNTFAGIDAHSDFLIDLYVHSLTKFVSGHSDVMGGAVLGSKKKIQQLRENQILLGATLDPHAAYLLLRGLDTYRLRRDKACENALLLAQFLEKQKDINKVYYPGLPSHPEFLLAEKQEDDFGTVVTVKFREKFDLYKFCDSLKYFKVTASLGSTKSLVAPLELFYARQLDDKQRKDCDLLGPGLRISVGIEDIEDLKNDFLLALK